MRLGDGGANIAGPQASGPVHNPPPPSWWSRPIVRRLGLALGGVLLGYFCEALPPGARVVCHALKAVTTQVVTAPGAFDESDAPSVELVEGPVVLDGGR